MTNKSESTQYPFSRSFSTVSLSSENAQPYNYATLPDHIYGYSSPSQDVIMLDETPEPPSQPSSQTESHSSGPSSITPKRGLPLDEYLDFGSDSSDEEAEGVAPGNSVATVAFVTCLWEGCRAALLKGTSYDVWKEHIKSAHLQQQEKGGTRRSRTTKIKCQWDGCCETFKQPQGFAKHIKKHLSDS